MPLSRHSVYFFSSHLWFQEKKKTPKYLSTEEKKNDLDTKNYIDALKKKKKKISENTLEVVYIINGS